MRKYTEGQRKGLWEMLKDQKSPMTTAEKKLFNELVEEFAEVVYTEKGDSFYRVGDKVKMTFMDTCEDDWRNNWLKVKETVKGEYIVSKYLGGKREYLKF